MLGNNTKTRIPETLLSNDRFGLNGRTIKAVVQFFLQVYYTYSIILYTSVISNCFHEHKFFSSR